jgi:uncharacterized protein DUF1707
MRRAAAERASAGDHFWVKRAGALHTHHMSLPDRTTGDTAPRPLRAGDSDRSAVVDLLRAHHLDGRLSVEEFEDRVERAHGAVTLLELGDLHEDLPELAPRRGKVVARGRRAPRIPGRLAFVERVELDVEPRTAREQAFEYIAPALARNGYDLTVVSETTLLFRCRWRPAWTVLLAVLMFPIGLLALMYQHEDEVVVEIGSGLRGGTAVLAHGVGPLNVRRAFANLRD